ncbi:MAG: hypothetical protein LBK95_13455 [Bifidobacteriaceae bacterium]|nr:hypothetical protein [Bifidobacteriaceae bacterium]
MTHETGRSVGALVREAVDAMLDSDGPGGNLERQTALARLWASGDEAPHPAPDNWEDVKASFERPFPRLS